jgi:hypothetical protein
VKTNRILYGAVLSLGVITIAGLRYVRRNDVDVPTWSYLLVVVVVAGALLSYDIWRRKGNTSSPNSGAQGSSE